MVFYGSVLAFVHKNILYNVEYLCQLNLLLNT